MDQCSSDDNGSDFTFGELVTYAISKAPSKFKTTIAKYQHILFNNNNKIMNMNINTYANVVKCLKLLKFHIYRTLDTVTIIKYNLIESEIHKHIRKSFKDLV